MQRRNILLIAAAIVATSALLRWKAETQHAQTASTGDITLVTQGDDDATPREQAAVAGDAPERTPTSRADAPRGTTTSATIPREPLPTPGTPVAEIFDTLLERAQRGDTAASCRLAVELQRCGEVRRAEAMISVAESSLARRDDTPEAAVQALARAQAQAEQRNKGCAGVTSKQLAHAFDLQLQTAQRVPAMRIWFALQPALDPWNFVNDLDRWQRYRDHAMPWLEQAAAEGDAAALIALARIHGDLRRNGPPSPPFRIPDAERFLVYVELMARRGIHFDAVDREAAQWRNTLGTDALARVAEQVARLDRPNQPSLDAASGGAALARSMRPTPQFTDCEIR